MPSKFRDILAKLLVDREFYAERYPDVADSNVDLVDHFARYGFDAPIRSPNRIVEIFLLKGISAILVFLSLKKIHRADIEGIYLSRARKAYQSGGFIVSIYYYFITQLILHLCRKSGDRSVVQYEGWLADYRAYNPSRISWLVKIGEILAPFIVAAEAYGLKISTSRAEYLLNTMIPRARKAYIDCKNVRYWAYHNVVKRLISKINHETSSSPVSGLQIVNHFSLDTVRRSGSTDCLVAEFYSRTPVGQAQVFGKGYKPRIRHLPRRDIIVPLLKNAKVFSRSNTVLVNNVAINDTGAHRRQKPYVLHSSDPLVVGKTSTEFLIKLGYEQVDGIERGVMLCGVATNAWGHWFSDFIARLEFCERFPKFASFPIIVDEEMPKSHFDLLRLVSGNDIFVLPSQTCIEVRELIYAPPLTFFPVHLFPNTLPANEVNPVNPQSYSFIKSRVESRLPPTAQPYRKIFLSRRSSSWRKLANDAEVATYLSTLGYETVQLELHDLEEQIRIFQTASHIVAANGSSLQGVIFCHTDVKLLILAQSYLSNWGAYNAQVGALGYKMQFLCGDPVGGIFGKHTDYVIPMPLLRKAMNAFDR